MDPSWTAEAGEGAAPAGEGAKVALGSRLGKYEIVRLVGIGGNGAVYEAVHTEIGKRVALKTMAPRMADVPHARQRFLREAKLTARLHHPHIINLTDMGTEGTTAYLVMELLHGEDLGTRLARQGPFQLRELIDLMLPVCSAVATAHEADIIHRDLKPQNIFLERDPRGVAPKVLDFGISRSLDSGSYLTSTGSVIGTPHYLAPEQIQDAHTASPASDQYSVGVVLYKCLANANPFSGDNIFDVLRAIGSQSPVPLRDRRPDLPGNFFEIVEKAMAPLPWERFSSMRELGRALLPYASLKARATWEDFFSKTPGRAAAAGAVVASAVPRATVELDVGGADDDVPPPAGPRRSRRRQSRARQSRPSRPGTVVVAATVAVLALGAGAVALRSCSRTEPVDAPEATVASPAASPPAAPPAAVPAAVPAAAVPAPAVPAAAPPPAVAAPQGLPPVVAPPSIPAEIPIYRHEAERRHRSGAPAAQQPAEPPVEEPPRVVNPSGTPIIE